MTNLHSENHDENPVEWNAVYTRYQHEKIVAGSLAKNGFEVFLPTYNTLRQWSDRKKQISLPLFPCYVFVRSNFDRRLRALSVPSIHSFVMFAGEPAVIPNAEMEAIRRTVQSGFPVEPHPFLQRGDWVRVISGPLVDVEGILVRKKSAYRLILSTRSLGKSIAVEVDAFSVKPLSKRPASLLTSDEQPVYRGDRRIAG